MHKASVPCGSLVPINQGSSLSQKEQYLPDLSLLCPKNSEAPTLIRNIDYPIAPHPVAGRYAFLAAVMNKDGACLRFKVPGCGLAIFIGLAVLAMLTTSGTVFFGIVVGSSSSSSSRKLSDNAKEGFADEVEGMTLPSLNALSLASLSIVSVFGAFSGGFGARMRLVMVGCGLAAAAFRL